MKQLVLGFVMVAAACQDTTTTSTSEQGLVNVCNIQGPPARPWKGGALPPTSPTTTIVLLDYGNQWRAYAADPAQHAIHWVLSVAPLNAGNLLAATFASGRNQVSIRNPPPPRCPPQTCGDDWYAFAVAQRAELIPGEAEADIDACYGP